MRYHHNFADHQHCLKCGKWECAPEADDCSMSDEEYELIIRSGQELPWRRLTVDWSSLLQYPRMTVECCCGAVYKTWHKLVSDNGTLRSITKDACPACDRRVDHVVRASSEPETYTLHG